MNHNKRSLALDVRHARAREILHKLVAMPLSAPPVRLSESAPADDPGSPALGQDTSAILSELGYRDSDVSELRRLGVV